MIRIATWNLARPRLFGVRTNAILEYISQIDADIWVLTESCTELSPGPEYARAAHSPDSADRSPDECWVAIWVRRNIESRRVETSDPKRAACSELVLPGGGTLIVYGTVLPWLGDKSRLPLKGADAFLATLAIQQNDWKHIRASSPDTPICVAGDFNQDLLPSGHYYGSVRGRAALRAALRDCDLACATGGVMGPIASRFSGHACVDHICISRTLAPGVAPVDLHVWPDPEPLGSKLSDHFGVALNLPWPV